MRASIASEVDNERVFTPPLNGSVTGSAVMETTMDMREGQYGISGGAHHPPWLGNNTNPPPGSGKHSGSVKYGKTGSINGGFVPSDNEMVYGYPPPSSVRSNGRRRGGGGRGRPPSSLRLDVGV